MFEIDNKSRKSISDQIIDNIKELIISGILVSGEKIPSVREFANELRVNPNTVSKAFQTLERQGFIYVSKGRGTFVADIEDIKVSPNEINEAKIYLREALNRFYYLGVSKAETRSVIEELLEGRGEWR